MKTHKVYMNTGLGHGLIIDPDLITSDQFKFIKGMDTFDVVLLSDFEELQKENRILEADLFNLEWQLSEVGDIG